MESGLLLQLSCLSQLYQVPATLLILLISFFHTVLDYTLNLMFVLVHKYKKSNYIDMCTYLNTFLVLFVFCSFLLCFYLFLFLLYCLLNIFDSHKYALGRKGRFFASLFVFAYPKTKRRGETRRGEIRKEKKKEEEVTC